MDLNIWLVHIFKGNFKQIYTGKWQVNKRDLTNQHTEMTRHHID